MKKIEALKKITVDLQAGSTAKNTATERSNSCTFIYGTASSGLCPFEQQLAGKNIGETITVEIGGQQLPLFFGHLLQPVKKSVGWQQIPDALSLTVAVVKIEDASQREVIQAMAASLGGGCGGDCDCGCSC